MFLVCAAADKPLHMDTSQDSSLWHEYVVEFVPPQSANTTDTELPTMDTCFNIYHYSIADGSSRYLLSTLLELTSIMITQVVHNIYYYQEKTLTRKEENTHHLSYVYPSTFVSKKKTPIKKPPQKKPNKTSH